MSVRSPKAWMPKDMLDADKDYFLSLHENDPHAAAAVAWEAWAATLDAEPTVEKLQTGAQAVWYGKGGSPATAAFDRAAFHRARAKVTSVAVGPKFRYQDVGGEDYEIEYLDEDGNLHKAIPTQEIRHWWMP